MEKLAYWWSCNGLGRTTRPGCGYGDRPYGSSTQSESRRRDNDVDGNFRGGREDFQTKANDSDHRGGTGMIMHESNRQWHKHAWSVNVSFAKEQGMSLIELMVGMFVALVVVAAAFTVLTTTQKSTQANDQTVETQQNVRIAMDLLSRDIKHAGFGMTGPVGACTTAIVPLDHTPAGADTGPDTIRLLVPIGTSIAPVKFPPASAVILATAPEVKVTLLKPAVAVPLSSVACSTVGLCCNVINEKYNVKRKQNSRGRLRDDWYDRKLGRSTRKKWINQYIANEKSEYELRS